MPIQSLLNDMKRMRAAIIDRMAEDKTQIGDNIQGLSAIQGAIAAVEAAMHGGLGENPDRPEAPNSLQ